MIEALGMKISSTCSLKGLVVQNAVQEIAERLGGSLNSSTFLIAHGDAHNTGDTVRFSTQGG